MAPHPSVFTSYMSWKLYHLYARFPPMWCIHFCVDVIGLLFSPAANQRSQLPYTSWQQWCLGLDFSHVACSQRVTFIFHLCCWAVISDYNCPWASLLLHYSHFYSNSSMQKIQALAIPSPLLCSILLCFTSIYVQLACVPSISPPPSPLTLLCW